MDTKKKRRDLTIDEKVAILASYDKLPKMGQRNAAVQLQISQPVLCRIIKSRVQIVKAAKQNDNLSCKRKRVGKDQQVESALKLWFTNVRQRDARVDGPLMQQKAEQLAAQMGKENFVATAGWFNRWKKRENIVFKRTHGEQRDADFSAADAWIEKEWPKIIAEYSPENIYNADETGLYYRALPEHTYLFKNESAKGCKTSKERLTVLCCVSMSGKKEKLLVIGKSKNPRCFKGVKHLPVDYCANKNAWMTTLFFNDWLAKWDKELDHCIILLVDNCTAHSVNVALKHIKVVFLPANTTSLIQPCDQGIIRSFKAYYRREMRTRILENMEDSQNLTANELAKKTNVLEALHLLAMSWKHVSDKTIQNCFSHGGFSNGERETEEIIYRPPDLTETAFNEWMAIDEDIQVAGKMTDSDICLAVTILDSESSDEEDEEQGEVEEVQTCQKVLTCADIRDALKTLRLAVHQKSGEFQQQYEYDSFINELLRKNIRQPTLKEYF